MKRLIMFIITMLFFFTANTQTIAGEFKRNPGSQKIYLYIYPDLMGYNSGGLQVDSSLIRNGRFHFDFEIGPEPKFAKLIQMRRNKVTGMIENLGELKLFLTKDSIVIFINDSLKNGFVLNSRVNYDAAILDEMVKPINQKISELYNIERKEFEEFSNEINKSSYSRYRFQRWALLDSQKSLEYKTFIKKYPYSWISLYAFILNLGQSESNMITDEIVALYSGLGNKLKMSELGISIAKRIEAKSKVSVGATAPSVQIPDTSGVRVSLSDYRGKYVLLEFWSSWCGACRHEAPILKSVYTKYYSKGFDILSVSLDDESRKNSGRRDWLNAITQDGTGLWKQVSDLKGWKSPVAVLYDIQSIPQNFLIDPSGKIISENLRGADLQDKLEDIFYQQ